MNTATRAEESRQFAQQRLALLYATGFGLALFFFVGHVATLRLVGEETILSASRWVHLGAIAVLGALWWLLRVVRFRNPALRRIDTVSVLAVSLLFDVSLGLFETRVVSVFNLAFVTGLFAVLRAVLVPSTAQRTLALGLAASVIASVVFVASAFHPPWPVAQHGRDELALPYQIAAFTLWLGGLVAIAAVASRVIYDLRREVQAARKLGEYVLGERLGGGGMGVVYRAHHALLRRETALKLLPPDRVDPATLRRFEREVMETARLRHPNTIAIYDYGRTPDGIFYYAMEYLDGLTLAELVATAGPLPPGRVISILSQVCSSLEEAHAIGLVHRDIKPANVMVVGHTAAYDLVKVLDFGLVKSTEHVDGGASLTQADQLTGTPLYMAPEAIALPGAADPRSDLYAVAALGYFLLTGHHVFEGGSPIAIYAAHLHERPVPPSERRGQEVPRDLEELVLRGLAKAPGDRPPSAAAFRAALERCAVQRWTEEDARAWWRTRGERAVRRDPAAPELAGSPTVSVLVGSDRAFLG